MKRLPRAAASVAVWSAYRATSSGISSRLWIWLRAIDRFFIETDAVLRGSGLGAPRCAVIVEEIELHL